MKDVIDCNVLVAAARIDGVCRIALGDDGLHGDPRRCASSIAGFRFA